MKQKLLLAVFISVCLPAGVCAQEYEWLAKAEAEKYINLTGMGSDAAGNIYISGRHERNVRFFNADQSSFVLHKAGDHSGYSYYEFIGKYNAKGSLEWLQSIVGEGTDIEHLHVDGQGNTYITGALGVWSTIFTSADGKNDTIRAQWHTKAFVAKYNSRGELKWINVTKQMYVNYLRKVTTDNNGLVYAMDKSSTNNQGLLLWVLDSTGKEVYYDHWTGFQVDAAEVNAKGELYAVLNIWDERVSQCMIDSVVYKDWKPRTRVLVKYVHGKPLKVIHSAWYGGKPYHNYGYKTDFRYINQISFDKRQQPVYSVVTQFDGWKVIRLGGREFHLEKGEVVLAELDEEGQIKWVQQSPVNMYYNHTLSYLPDGRWSWVCPVTADLAVKVPVQRGKYSSQWLNELSYNVLDKRGNYVWSIRGGGTASNYHVSHMVPYGKDKFLVSSDILDYAVLKGRTIKGEGGGQTCLYIGVIGEKLKPVYKPVLEQDTAHTDTIPAVAALEADKPAADRAVSDDNKRERTAGTGNTSTLPERKIAFAVYPNPTQGVFKLLVTSDAETQIDVLVTDGNGKEIYNTKHKVQPGQNQVEFDLGSQSVGYYFVRVLENGMPFCTRVLKE